METLKSHVKRLAFDSGALSAWRGVRAPALTSILFHRVLPAGDPRAPAADRDYTMRLDIFEACLDALRAWYCPVSLGDIEAAMAGRQALPGNALLITFDDGWEDTARYAVPALQKRDMPSLIFITTGAIGREDVPWRDIVALALRAGALSLPDTATASPDASRDGLDALLDWLDGMVPEERGRILQQALDTAGSRVRPLMMTPETLRKLAEDGVGLGGHGTSHIPLTTLVDVERELLQCQTEFKRLTGRVPRSFAFPHGLYSANVLTATRRSGYDLIFTSDRHLNPLRKGRPVSSVFGRISMSERDVTDGSGAFSAQKLAYWLTLQPRKVAP